jgi:hypothetical protein
MTRAAYAATFAVPASAPGNAGANRQL